MNKRKKNNNVIIIVIWHSTECPKKHGNKQTTPKSSLNRINVELPKFTGQNKVTPAINSVKSLFTRISDITKYNTVCNKNINKQILNSSRLITAFLVGITIINQKIIYKDGIKILIEFPCLLGHPTLQIRTINSYIFFSYEFFLNLHFKFFLQISNLNFPNVLFHIVGRDQVSADVTNFFPFSFITSSLVGQVYMLQIQLFLLKNFVTLLPTANIVPVLVPCYCVEIYFYSKQEKKLNEVKKQVFLIFIIRLNYSFFLLFLSKSL